MSLEIYKKLDLSVQEGQIFTIMVSKLVRTKEEIALLSDMEIQIVEDLLKSLEEKKLIRMIPGKVPQYHALAPPVAISKKMVSQVEKITSEYQNEINSHWKQGQLALQSIIDHLEKGVNELLEFKNGTTKTLESFDNNVNQSFKIDEEHLEREIEKNTQINKDSLEICGHLFTRTLQATFDKDLLNLTDNVEKIQSNFHEGLHQFITETSKEKKNNISQEFETWTIQVENEIEGVISKTETQRDDKLAISKDYVEETEANIEKTALTFSNQFPKLVEEFTAQQNNELNILDRNVKGTLNKIKSQIHEIDKEVDNRLNKRISFGKGGFEDIKKMVNLSLNELNSSQTDLEKQIEDMIQNTEQKGGLITDNVTSNVNNQNLEFQNLLNKINTDLTEIIKNSFNESISTLASVSDNFKSSSLKQKETIYNHINQLSGLLAERNIEHLQTTVKVLNSFLDHLKVEIQSMIDKLIQNTTDCLAITTNTLTQSSQTYIETINRNFVSIFSSVDSEVKESILKLDEIQSKLENEINSSIRDVNSLISTNFNKSVETIPDKFSKGLAQGQEIINALGEINTLAMEIPIEQIESTYFQIISFGELITRLKAILKRTKSTIQIIIPTISMLPIDELKQIKRRRIQILTRIDSEEEAKDLKSFDNIQIRSYDDLGHIYAIARDGTEEVIIGSGKTSKISIITSVDEDLVAILKEVIQDYWPRGKAI